MKTENKENQGWDVICTYTTGEAVKDGALILVNEKASKEAAIKFPVFLTHAVFAKYVQVPKVFKEHQDESGRLWDLLYMFTAKAFKNPASTLEFQFICMLPNVGDWEQNEKRIPDMPDHREITLKSVIQARDFDDPSPAIFIMKPNED
ncbi:MAG: DUF6573 family protein [Bacteroidales bacterium]